MATLRSAEVLVDRVLADPALTAKVQADPQNALPQVAKEVIRSMEVPNTLVYQIVVAALGLTVLLAISGAIYLSSFDTPKPIPELLTAIGSAAVGALAGLLAPSPRQ